MLSPFETYDLLFVRDTINNLNSDNEVLNQNAEDLKNGFLFLYRKHKELLLDYEKECMNRELLENYRKRVADLILKDQKTQEKNLQLRYKLQLMKDMMMLAVDEQA